MPLAGRCQMTGLVGILHGGIEDSAQYRRPGGHHGHRGVFLSAFTARILRMATGLAPGFRYSGQARHRLSDQEIKSLARAYGLPGTAIAQIAKGESGGYADVQQRDPGDGMVGYGLLQMTPNAWGKNSAAYKHMQS